MKRNQDWTHREVCLEEFHHTVEQVQAIRQRIWDFWAGIALFPMPKKLWLAYLSYQRFLCFLSTLAIWGNRWHWNIYLRWNQEPLCKCRNLSCSSESVEFWDRLLAENTPCTQSSHVVTTFWIRKVWELFHILEDLHKPSDLNLLKTSRQPYDW